MSKIIENYCLEEIVGEGQYGKVYRAKDTKDTSKLFAIKVVKIQKFKENPKLEECTINEIRILSKMESNPHVVKFIELLKTANNYYFVYEYCSGGTLEELIIKQRFLKEKRANLIMRQLMSAFKSLNQHKILHRDLKPSNILVNNDIIKLADFGFCKPLQYKEQMVQTMLGSPIYMAPEVLKGQEYCIKADIWSLGVVYFEMLFGYCPFEERSIAKLIMVLEEQPLKINRKLNPISQEAEELMKQLLIKNPDKRISWEDLFAYEIDDEGNIHRPQKQQQQVKPINLQQYSTPNSQNPDEVTPSNRFMRRAQTIEIKNYAQFQADLKTHGQQPQAEVKNFAITPQHSVKKEQPQSTHNLENSEQKNSARNFSQPSFQVQKESNKKVIQQQNSLSIPEETEFKNPISIAPLGEHKNTQNMQNIQQNNQQQQQNSKSQYKITYTEQNKIEYKPLSKDTTPVKTMSQQPESQPQPQPITSAQPQAQFRDQVQQQPLEQENIRQLFELIIQERNKVIFLNKIILETQEYDLTETSLEMLYWLFLALNNHMGLMEKTFVLNELSLQISFPEICNKMTKINSNANVMNLMNSLRKEEVFGAFQAVLKEEIEQNEKTRAIYAEQFESHFSNYSVYSQQQFSPKKFREIAKKYVENCQKQTKNHSFLYGHLVKIIDAANLNMLFSSMGSQYKVGQYFDDICLYSNEELKQKYNEKLSILV